MDAVFVELPAFARYRSEYLDDEGFRALQNELLEKPDAGDVIEGTYRVDGIVGSTLSLTYLPLNIQQKLDVGHAG